jgi:peptidoglycan/xylan/chitin deacetylase (PgdA/CDA1 family)
MIPVLTYHAVGPAESKRGGDFYTITPEGLERHFTALTGRRCMALKELSEAKTFSGNEFVLTFDDGTSDHLEIVAPLLQKHGWRATFFVPTAKLNRPGYLTNEQLQALARAGHTIGLHSHEHRRLDVVTDDELREQMSRSLMEMEKLLGQRPRTFAPPGGFINEHIREVALGFGVEVIRTMRWGYNRTVEHTHLETIPINRHTSDAKFQRILEGRETHRLYAWKEAVKAVVPARAYERLRTSLFKVSNRN